MVIEPIEDRVHEAITAAFFREEHTSYNVMVLGETAYREYANYINGCFRIGSNHTPLHSNKFTVCGLKVVKNIELREDKIKIVK